MTLAFSILVRFFFSFLRTGFLSLQNSRWLGYGVRIETIAAHGNRSARRRLRLLDNLNAYISATQLGITMASLALGWIGEPCIIVRPLFGDIDDCSRSKASSGNRRA